jgi:nucleoside-diphosphate-sugar epimerase
MKKDIRVLLLGGNGFLGRGIQDELNSRSITYKSIDICDVDLSKEENINIIESELKDVTHVVLLAAKIGRKLFNEHPIENCQINERIFNNVIESIKNIHRKHNKKFDFIFYSTSEVYGSITRDSIITPETPFKLNDEGRGLYANQKAKSEEVLKKLLHDSDIFNSVKIIRPFNISGKYQKRGVVYDMINDALNKKRIWYNSDTIRSFTSDIYAKKRAVDIIIDDSSNLIVENLSEHITVDMKTVANIIKTIVGDEVKLYETESDSIIQYRQTSRFSNINDGKLMILRHCILRVMEDFKL